MKICVVALGKIGLPLAVQFASKGHEVLGADVAERVVALVNDGEIPFPGETDLDVKLKAVVETGHLRAITDTSAAVALADAVVVVVPLFVDADSVPDFAWMDSATRAIAAGPASGHARQLRDHAAGRHHPQPVDADARRGLRTARGPRLLRGVQSGARAHRTRLRRSAPLPETRRRHRRGVGPAGGRLLRVRARLRRAHRPERAERRLGPRFGRGIGTGEARRDDVPGREHRAREPVRPLRGHHRRRRPQGHRGLQHAAVQPHPPAGHRGRWALHPGVPPALPLERPGRDGRAPRRGRRTPRCRITRSTCSPPRTAT